MILQSHVKKKSYSELTIIVLTNDVINNFNDKNYIIRIVENENDIRKENESENDNILKLNSEQK